MPKWKYNIIMHTQLGERLGTMLALVNYNQVSGSIDIMEHCEPFSGIIDEDGNCEIKGKIITLMRTIEYVGTGTLKPNSVHLTINGERDNFKINGASCCTGKDLV